MAILGVEACFSTFDATQASNGFSAVPRRRKKKTYSYVGGLDIARHSFLTLSANWG